MIGCDAIAQGLRGAGYPVAVVTPTLCGEWITAEFRLPGGSVTLALPPETATAGGFARLYDLSVGAPEAT